MYDAPLPDAQAYGSQDSKAQQNKSLVQQGLESAFVQTSFLHCSFPRHTALGFGCCFGSHLHAPRVLPRAGSKAGSSLFGTICPGGWLGGYCPGGWQ